MLFSLMLVFEYKLKGTNEQYRLLDEVLRTARFLRNSCLRYWMDNPGKNKYDLNNYCTVLAKEYPFAKKLNSMARQASAERAWSAISHFTRFVKPKSQVKKDSLSFAKNRLTLPLSTKLAAGSYQKIGEKSPSLMGSKLERSKCGELVTSTTRASK